MIDIDQVSYRYPEFQLGPLSLQLSAGARCALVGRNGAGKTTLLSILAGQISPTTGSASVAGVDVATATWAVRERVSFVTDDLLCCPWMTADEHFRFLSQFYDQWREEDAYSLASALELPLNKQLQVLSRGNKLKVALCSAWGQQAQLLLLDEPTAGLDPLARDELLRQLTEQLSKRPELTVVFATHILEDLDALGLTDLLVLREGSGSQTHLAQRHAAASHVARSLLFSSAGVSAS